MMTIGVDLAAEPKKTALARIDWSSGSATVRDVHLDTTDRTIVEAVTNADKVGIDCPFGWPEAFVAFITAHQGGNVAVPQGVTGLQWRRALAYRVTDQRVRAETGLRPLSVAADRIAHTAMRCAGLLATLAGQGLPVDRAGGGVVVEVYPAASLAGWGLPHLGYKTKNNISVLATLVDALLDAAPWLDLGAHADLCRRSDDAFDAVIAALTARAVALGHTALPGPDDVSAAEREGWIALPTSPLSSLVPDHSPRPAERLPAPR
ncbi:hypothetical protein CC117_25880 [Parafrankia colletiae]|uniref:DUF429 domain-containing protein n=1 Tax=Parafrankia colletiae TaxID=573497 RepID=A0A1S1QEY6_9ACTN|nr:hypothetical protein CC117_25880 [Parafrankia colletiae]